MISDIESSIKYVDRRYDVDVGDSRRRIIVNIIAQTNNNICSSCIFCGRIFIIVGTITHFCNLDLTYLCYLLTRVIIILLVLFI